MKFRTALILSALVAVNSVQSATSGPKSNISLNRAVYQSGSADDHHCGHLTTDGSDSTYWQSPTGAGAWIYVDLGKVHDLSDIYISWGDNPALAYIIQVADQPAGEYTVSRSASGISRHASESAPWRTAYTNTNGKGGKEHFVLPEGTKGRYVRLYTTSVANPSQGCSVREFNVSSSTPADRGKQVPDLTKGTWEICHTMFAGNDGQTLSVRNTKTDTAAALHWIPATVPGTILGSYVDYGALPDPFYGDQMSMISEEFFSYGSFWYRTGFDTPQGLTPGERVFLVLDGVNWKGEVYVNGAHAGSTRGAFERNRFDITDLLIAPGNKSVPKQRNGVAVLIRPLDNPQPSQAIPMPDGKTKAKVLHKYIGAPTANGDVLCYDSPTFVASSGWNWLPIVRGRNLGLWNHAYLDITREVEISDPWISSRLNLPDTTIASLTVNATLKNNSGRSINGILKVSFDGVDLQRPVTLNPHETRDISLSEAAFPQLAIHNPRLWWPNGYGAPNLYNAKVSFEADGKTSDSKSFDFGIRDLQCQDENGIMYIYVNGYRILLRGGNWGMAEGMLRCDSTGYDLRVRLHRDANLNMIRNWVGQTGHREFYDACNRYGILVFDDFWLANPCDGPDPRDYKMFLDNVKDKIRAVRQHPSVAFYCGRNEGFPPEALDEGMREAVAALDSTRHYEPNSAGGLLTGLGPYEPQTANWYYENRGRTFHSELGIIAIPEAESIREMMPAENLWPINDMWAVHDYQTPRSQIYTHFVESRYGMPLDIDQYSRKSQMFNMENSKSMFESLKDHQGSGLLLWMSQAAWPSLICQLYDHYFEPTASYFGTKRACAPVSIFINPLTKTVRASNNTIKQLSGLKAEAAIYDLDGHKAWSGQTTLDLPVGTAADCFTPDVPASLQGKTYFTKLSLYDGNRLLAENFYWSEDSDSTCLALNGMKQASVKGSARRSNTDGRALITVKLDNGNSSVALMVRLKLRDKVSGKRILPVIYDDNYISLLPGESRTVELEVAPGILKGTRPAIRIEGWNTVPAEIAVK